MSDDSDDETFEAAAAFPTYSNPIVPIKVSITGLSLVKPFIYMLN